MLEITNFDAIKIGLTSPEKFRAWSTGEVKKPETINYRTLKPEKDGLFCEKIFGPTKDWECYCGKYKRVRFKGIICERCGVEITRSKVRRSRMGHIELAAPVSHIWYFKGVPSRMGYLLDLSPKDLEKVLYFAAYLITDVDVKRRENDLEDLGEQFDEENRLLEEEKVARVQEIKDGAEQEIEALKAEIEAADEAKAKDKGKGKSKKDKEEKDEKARAKPKPSLTQETKRIEKRMKSSLREVEREYADRQENFARVFETFTHLSRKQLISNEPLFRELKDRYGAYFKGGMGAEVIKDLLGRVDLEAETKLLKESIAKARGQTKNRATKRLKVVSSLRDSDNKPEWMIMDVLPVIPPDLRPMVQLDGGRFATSDLNDLYRRVINRNNRLKRLLDLGAPEIIVNNEKRMLQEAVDALFDNGRRGRPVTGPGNRALKSLSDMLKGKQGRFRQNLLGKRVDYSGRSVIVIGPQLRLHQCGLPKAMALELFKPFVMRRLVEMDQAQNIKSARRLVERGKGIVWDILEEVIKEHPVLLNRAPTLHRLGIQAFEPTLVEGKAIQVHPLVCAAFNADFDGDQMAVHVPLSAEAQAECRVLMLSSNNILSPAHGKPLAIPSQDMVLGIYYLTMGKEGAQGEGKVFFSPEEAIQAYEAGDVHLQAEIELYWKSKKRNRFKTTVGRVIFNQALPKDYPYVNEETSKRGVSEIAERCAVMYEKARIAEILDNIKRVGFRYATKAGVTLSIKDVEIPPDKQGILDKPEGEVASVERQFRKGLITNDERHQQVVSIWTKATEDVTEAMEDNFTKANPLFMMASSGARGNIKQIRQLAGMRGLVANPKGEIIDRPIKANFREGLTVLEYFISIHGARKGLADTALRTADSGYLTRRLVDVAQEVIVRENDCGTKEGIFLAVKNLDGSANENLLGRIVQKRVTKSGSKKVLLSKGSDITKNELDELAKAKVPKVLVRSVLTCESLYGICQLCYGHSLAEGRLVDLGEAVGIVAAQSIGEPGTQLTMRTFHTGGVAGEDITHGLPRVVELFEARRPRGQAILAEASGKLSVIDEEKSRKIVIDGTDGKERSYQVPRRARLRVSAGDKVKAGDQLTEGSLYPPDILRVKGAQATQIYLVEEIQKVYHSQGVDINDKHVELIVRQMLKKMKVEEQGDTALLPGQLIDVNHFNAENEGVQKDGGEAATAKQVLLGITKSSLATESFLSAASFQETTRVLTDAAISGKVDPLLGLKENVIIGKLIPAATGMTRYRSLKIRFTEEAEADLPQAKIAMAGLTDGGKQDEQEKEEVAG